MLAVSLGSVNPDGNIKGVHDKAQLFVAVKVSCEVVLEEITIKNHCQFRFLKVVSFRGQIELEPQPDWSHL